MKARSGWRRSVTSSGAFAKWSGTISMPHNAEYYYSPPPWGSKVLMDFSQFSWMVDCFVVVVVGWLANKGFKHSSRDEEVKVGVDVMITFYPDIHTIIFASGFCSVITEIRYLLWQINLFSIFVRFDFPFASSSSASSVQNNNDGISHLWTRSLDVGSRFY